MNLELGIVRECAPGGCVVQLLGGTSVQATFAHAVRDTIRIRRDQLVAVNVEADEPEIVWRWFVGEVEAVDASGISVRRLDQPPGSCRVIATSLTTHSPVVGERVYYGRTDDWAVVDIAGPAGPSQPDEIRRLFFDRIAAAYSGA